jgi:dolichol-phosphate mannosyltransferase
MIALISLVVPAFNEGEDIAENVHAILERATDTTYELELIVIDDGSTDATPTVLTGLQAADPRIHVLTFTRNFGKEAALLAGLSHARGQAAVVLDGDLQHPPELIPRMVALWRQGVCVVEGMKIHRGEEAFHNRLFARCFYTLFYRFSGLKLDGHSDFKLLDREAINLYLAFPEKRRFFRGLVKWAGFPSAQIPFSVPTRAGEKSGKWTKLKLIRYAVDNLTSFSSLPLNLVSYLGFITLLFGLVIGTISLVQKFEGKALNGFTTVNLLVIIMGGAILVSLGIIGHYISRLYDEIKNRPSYVIKPSERKTKE